VLEVAVPAPLALAHRLERPHAAIELVGPALVEDRLARALLRAGEETADHDAVGAGGDRLGDVARELDAAVGDQEDAGARRGPGPAPRRAPRGPAPSRPRHRRAAARARPWRRWGSGWSSRCPSR